VLEQLDNSSLLLMYLADELPAGQRAALQQRLTSDASLRAELESLQEAQADFLAGMTKLDAAAPISSSAAIARITRAMHQHEVRRLVLSPKPAANHFWQRVPRWSYAVGAVAAMLLVYVGVWTLRPLDPTKTTAVATNNHPAIPAVDEGTPTPDDTLADAEGLEQNLRTSNPTQTESFHALNRIEAQGADLSQNASDPLPGLLSNNHLLTEDE